MVCLSIHPLIDICIISVVVLSKTSVNVFFIKSLCGHMLSFHWGHKITSYLNTLQLSRFMQALEAEWTNCVRDIGIAKVAEAEDTSVSFASGVWWLCIWLQAIFFVMGSPFSLRMKSEFFLASLDLSHCAQPSFSGSLTMPTMFFPLMRIRRWW